MSKWKYTTYMYPNLSFFVKPSSIKHVLLVNGVESASTQRKQIILNIVWGFRWMIFSARFKSAPTSNKKFPWRWCSFRCNSGRGQQFWVTLVQRHLSGYNINIFTSKMEDLDHHDRDVLIRFLDRDNFCIPFLCLLIVFSCDYLISCFCCCCSMKIPIYSCKLFTSFVNFITATWVWKTINLLSMLL